MLCCVLDACVHVCAASARTCAPGTVSARRVWKLGGESITHAARTRVHTRTRTPHPRDSNAAGGELQPQRTGPRRPRGRGGGFLSSCALQTAVVWAVPGQVERSQVHNSPPPPPQHHTHAQPQALIQTLALLLQTLPDLPQDPSHWGR